VDTLRPLSDHAEVLTPVGVTLRPLDVKPDSVIVVSMPKASPVQMLDRFSLFSQALKKRLGDGVLVVGVEQNTSIDVLADQLLPLGRAILPQEEVLRLQGRDTRAALLEVALGEWLDARTPGRLPRDTAEWTAHLGRQLEADSALEREVRRLGVGPGREGEDTPVVTADSSNPHTYFVTYKGERREGDWSQSGHHARLGWTNGAIAIYAWEHGTPAPRDARKLAEQLVEQELAGEMKHDGDGAYAVGLRVLERLEREGLLRLGGAQMKRPPHPSEERSEKKLPYGSLQALPGVRFAVKEEGAGVGHVWLLPRFTAIRARVEDVVMEMEGWEPRTKAWADWYRDRQKFMYGAWVAGDEGAYVPGGLTISDDDDAFNPRKV